MKNLMLVAMLMMVGCGSETLVYCTDASTYCMRMADAWCASENNCVLEPEYCDGWLERFDMCYSQNSQYEMVYVADECLWMFETLDECDAPVGIPDECPVPCSP